MTTARPSRNFDRAADFYDRTRSLPSDAMAEIIPMLAAELEGRGGCLEIGVGTGRFALPLHHAGIPMFGIDVSRRMMAVLLEKAGGRLPFPLGVADATRCRAAEGTRAWVAEQFGPLDEAHPVAASVNWRAYHLP